LHLFHEFFLRELLRFIAPTLPIRPATFAQTFLVPLLWTLSWGAWIIIFQFFLKTTKLLRTSKGAWAAIILTHLGSSQIILVSKWLAISLGLKIE
jgi:hypothetical protein